MRKTKLGENHPMFGKHHSEETRQKIGKAKLGENNPNWQNGKSFEPYGLEFNKELKQQVLERDNYECLNPNCEHLSEGLDCHHIDYEKKNNNLEYYKYFSLGFLIASFGIALAVILFILTK